LYFLFCNLLILNQIQWDSDAGSQNDFKKSVSDEPAKKKKRINYGNIPRDERAQYVKRERFTDEEDEAIVEVTINPIIIILPFLHYYPSFLLIF
jgi:hypothetical protein